MINAVLQRLRKSQIAVDLSVFHRRENLIGLKSFHILVIFQYGDLLIVQTSEHGVNIVFRHDLPSVQIHQTHHRCTETHQQNSHQENGDHRQQSTALLMTDAA